MTNSIHTNRVRSARYALIAGLCKKKHATVKAYFLRHGMDVMELEHAETYLVRFWSYSTIL